jgi:hypothetical protein
MNELLDVIEVKAGGDYSLELTFENGAKRRFDMGPLLDRKPFVRIKQPSLFITARIEHGTVVWPGGIDIAPETLWEQSVPMRQDGESAPLRPSDLRVTADRVTTDHRPPPHRPERTLPSGSAHRNAR